MQQNIEMPSYCSTQTFDTTTYLIFSSMFSSAFKWEQFFLTVGQNHESACATCAKFARPRKKARNIEYKCLNQFVSDASESRIFSFEKT